MSSEFPQDNFLLKLSLQLIISSTVGTFQTTISHVYYYHSYKIINSLKYFIHKQNYLNNLNSMSLKYGYHHGIANAIWR